MSYEVAFCGLTVATSGPLSPQTSTPSVLLSTHSISSKSCRVKLAAAAKVKAHLFPGPFVQGCHYAGCDQATKFSSKINRAMPPPPHPQGDAPPGRVSSFSEPSLAEDLLPVYSTPSIVFSCTQLFLITLTSFLLSFLCSSSLLLIFFLALLSLISCLCISSLIFYPASISLFFWPSLDTPKSGNWPIPALPQRPSAQPRG